MTIGNADTMPAHSTDRRTKTSSGRLKAFVFWSVPAVLILAMIVWFLIPPYADYTPKAKVAEVLVTTSVAREQIVEFYRKHNRLPRDAAEANISLGSIGKIREMTYDGEKGELRAVIQDIPEVNGRTMVLKAELSSGHVVWRCFSDEIPKDFLSGICRRQ